MVESGLNPEARSPAGARGLWQFMYYTAKAEGLRIDSYIDERKDPVRATGSVSAFEQTLQYTAIGTSRWLHIIQDREM